MIWPLIATFSLLSRYFSYEHFYVIYCRFWELDGDHDFLIDKENLIKYGNHALTYRIVDRIFSQVGSRCQNVLHWTLFFEVELSSFMPSGLILRLCLSLRSLGNLRAKLRGRWVMKILHTSFSLRRISHLSLVLSIGTRLSHSSFFSLSTSLHPFCLLAA